jgi:hypothetical protein
MVVVVVAASREAFRRHKVALAIPADRGLEHNYLFISFDHPWVPPHRRLTKFLPLFLRTI